MYLELKKAMVEDIPRIYQLADKIWHYHYVPIIGKEQVEYMLSKMYSADSLTEQMTKQNHNFHLVFLNDMAIGFISISGESNCYIHKFYIDQDVQGQGIGTNVFTQIQKMYPRATSYTLTVNRKNYKSINFYFKLGFTIDHIDDFDIGDGYYMNDFIMKWQNHSSS